MLPYHPNSDALLGPLALPLLPAEPVLSLPVFDVDLVFALAVFALLFFSLLESFWSPVDFGGVDLGWADDLVAFASIVFLGVDLGIAFGVGFGVALGFAVAFGTGVSIGVGFGNSISLLA
jgi:hypothetical protein